MSDLPPLPPGSTDALNGLARKLTKQMDVIDGSGSTQRQLVGNVIGYAWSGPAASKAEEAVERVMGAYRTAVNDATDIVNALKRCSTGWADAENMYKRAQGMLAQAEVEEADQRRRAIHVRPAGSQPVHVQPWVSPLRPAAIKLAQEAIHNHNTASQHAAATLDGISQRIKPPDGFVSVPTEPWYDRVLGDVGHFAAGAWHVVREVLDPLSDPAEAPMVANLLRDSSGLVGSLLLAMLSASGEGGGAALDGTGVGAIAGVPIGAVSIAGLTTSTGLGGYFSKDLFDDLRTLESRSKQSIVDDPDYLGRPTDPGYTPDGGQPYDPEVADRVPEWGADGTPKTSGALQTGDGEVTDITSGFGGVSLPDDLPPGARVGTGLNQNLVSHVEAQAAIYMRMTGETEGTLYINRPPCDGCARFLERFVPQGSTPTIYGPEGTSEVIEGQGPHIPGVGPGQ